MGEKYIYLSPYPIQPTSQTSLSFIVTISSVLSSVTVHLLFVLWFGVHNITIDSQLSHSLWKLRSVEHVTIN